MCLSILYINVRPQDLMFCFTLTFTGLFLFLNVKISIQKNLNECPIQRLNNRT
jgi:hypothetical protein